MPNLQRYPWNLYLINDMEDIVVFLGLKLFNSDNINMFSCSRNAQVTFIEKLSVWKVIKIETFLYWIRQAFLGTVGSRALPFLHGVSLEITLTAPLKRNFNILNLWLKQFTQKGPFALNGSRREGWLLPGFWSAHRIMELLPGFWSKMGKFIRPFMKSPLKREL